MPSWKLTCVFSTCSSRMRINCHLPTKMVWLYLQLCFLPIFAIAASQLASGFPTTTVLINKPSHNLCNPTHSNRTCRGLLKCPPCVELLIREHKTPYVEIDELNNLRSHYLDSGIYACEYNAQIVAAFIG